MSGSEHAPGYVPNPHYTQEDWDDVNSPEATDDELSQMRPASEAMPELVAAMRTRRELRESAEAPFSLHVEQDVLDAFRATGPGWQGRMTEVLRKAVGL